MLDQSCVYWENRKRWVEDTTLRRNINKKNIASWKADGKAAWVRERSSWAETTHIGYKTYGPQSREKNVLIFRNNINYLAHSAKNNTHKSSCSLFMFHWTHLKEMKWPRIWVFACGALGARAADVKLHSNHFGWMSYWIWVILKSSVMRLSQKSIQLLRMKISWNTLSWTFFLKCVLTWWFWLNDLCVERGFGRFGKINLLKRFRALLGRRR